MDGLKFYNMNDTHNRWSLDKVLEIVTTVKSYADRKGLADVELLSVEDNTWSDSVNQRYDIEIQYYRDTHLIWQKLLMLRGEVIDGQEFHDRFEEFYPEKVA